MANASSANVRHLREARTFNKGTTAARSQRTKATGTKTKQSSAFELVKETARYEKYCKYWSLLSNFGAVISVASAFYGVFSKRR
jgi:hypothetical protein